MKAHPILRWLTTAILLVFLCASAAPVFAAQEDRTVRVGCVDIDSFLTLSNGSAAGYGADYLREISAYTGWSYEYVSGTWSQCLQWLREGQIDLLLPAEYSEERAEDFLFSSQECCIDYVALLAGQDSGLYYEDYANYDGITVGMIRDNYLNDCFVRYAADHGFTYQTVYYATGAEMSAALAEHSVDAIVTGNLDIDPDTEIIAKFDYMPAYFITGKANADLMAELDDALYRINLENPYFTAGLYDTYYAPFVSQTKVFTREEAEYIAGAQPLRVVCDSDNYPFEWYDAATETYRGIDVDILKLIAENSGLTLEFVHTDSLLRSWEMMRAGEAELIAGVYLNDRLADAYGADATISYTDEVSSAVCRRGRTLPLSDIRTVALRESFVGTAEYLRINYPDWTIVTCADADACLKAVENGDADITFVGVYRLQTEPVLDDHPQLSVLSGVSISVPMMLGVSADASPLLCPVLNKAIRTVSQSEKQQIAVNNTAVLSDAVSFAALLREYPGTVILAAILVFSVIVFCAFLAYHSHMQEKYSASLEAKNEELSRANRAINTFFSQMSHDMRTPMNAVLSFSQFGLESDAGDEAKTYFQKIQNSGQYLLALINDTLDISKIDTGKLELHPEPYAFSELEATLENILRVSAEEKGVALEIVDKVSPGSAALFDKTHLQQILVNLLNNAIKFTPAGGRVALCIERETADAGRTAARFSVTDNGIGIGPDFLRDKLYKPFEQERRERDGAEMGTGLGLSIVKNLVDFMGGTIRCESEPGRGTVFTVVLPTAFVDAAPAAPRAQAAGDGLRGKHILLCEDDPVNREIIVKLLGNKQAVAETAQDGQAGLDAFARSKPGYYDAVLMDLRMPVMDGIEAAKRIRALERADAKTVPIIAITANVFASDAEQCAQAGMNAHLAKPIEPQKLYDALTALMQTAGEA
ncbi:MAG: transporter substrate-binding domain-containing protein [Oscillospiraceae bacterium]|nr:transporter substrate-binding domain-containing protein [Oscillospiraceae bacterium]